MSDLKYQDITESLSVVKKQALEEQRGRGDVNDLNEVRTSPLVPARVAGPSARMRPLEGRQTNTQAKRAVPDIDDPNIKAASRGRGAGPAIYNTSAKSYNPFEGMGSAPGAKGTAVVAGGAGVATGAALSANRNRKKSGYGNEFDIQEQEEGINPVYENKNKKELNAVVEALKQIYEMNDKEEELEEQEGEEEELEESPLIAAAPVAAVTAFNAEAPLRAGYAAAELAKLGLNTKVGKKIGAAAQSAVKRATGTPTSPRGMAKGPSRRGGRSDTSRPSGMQK